MGQGGLFAASNVQMQYLNMCLKNPFSLILCKVCGWS